MSPGHFLTQAPDLPVTWVWQWTKPAGTPLCSSRALTASLQLLQPQLKEAPSLPKPPASVRPEQLFMGHVKKENKSRNWLGIHLLLCLFCYWFCLVFFSLYSFILIHTKFPDSEFCQPDWGGGRQQHHYREELPLRGGSKSEATNTVPPWPLKEHSRTSFPTVHYMQEQSNYQLSVTSLGELKPFIQGQGHTQPVQKTPKSKPNISPVVLPLVK